ncbi:hypothetical protein [Planotetraspora sp. GP83]|uniref:hypothetical protein n=1 Tax=Planotetraspora sp. GP83 TaxID=3156264 RepID=UPI00351567F7
MRQPGRGGPARRQDRPEHVGPKERRRGVREVVDAFLAAARGGDFDGLVAVLDPGIVLRVDEGAAPAAGLREVRGAAAVARQALSFQRFAQPALVNGAVGLVTALDGRPMAVMGLTINDRKIVAMDILADPDPSSPARPGCPGRLTGLPVRERPGTASAVPGPLTYASRPGWVLR